MAKLEAVLCYPQTYLVNSKANSKVINTHAALLSAILLHERHQEGSSSLGDVRIIIFGIIILRIIFLF